MSGWRGSGRRGQLPSNWQTLRKLTKQAANGQCQHVDLFGTQCPNPGTDCDHKIPGNNHNLSNLQWLCETHHKQKTQAEAKAAQKARYATARKREPEPHPGTI